VVEVGEVLLFVLDSGKDGVVMSEFGEDHFTFLRGKEKRVWSCDGKKWQLIYEERELRRRDRSYYDI